MTAEREKQTPIAVLEPDFLAKTELTEEVREAFLSAVADEKQVPSIRPATRQFLAVAFKESFPRLDPISLKLIIAYFGSNIPYGDPRLQKIAGVQSQTPVRVKLLQSLMAIWQDMPSWLKGKFSQKTILKLKTRARPVTEEARRKLSQAHQGLRHTPEAKDKIRRARSDRRDSLETRLKKSKIAFGKQLSEETRRKIGDTLKRVWRNQYGSSPLAAQREKRRTKKPAREDIEAIKLTWKFASKQGLIEKLVESGCLTREEAGLLNDYYSGASRRKPPLYVAYKLFRAVAENR